MWGEVLTQRYLVSNVLPLALNLVALHLLYFSSGDWFSPRKPGG